MFPPAPETTHTCLHPPIHGEESTSLSPNTQLNASTATHTCFFSQETSKVQAWCPQKVIAVFGFFCWLLLQEPGELILIKADYIRREQLGVFPVEAQGRAQGCDAGRAFLLQLCLPRSATPTDLPVTAAVMMTSMIIVLWSPGGSGCPTLISQVLCTHPLATSTSSPAGHVPAVRVTVQRHATSSSHELMSGRAGLELSIWPGNLSPVTASYLKSQEYKGP